MLDVKPVQLKVFIDKKKNKVMFAQADEDFVEILFSFLTLPLATIAKLLTKHTDLKDTKVESLTSLYNSIVNLNVEHFADERCKEGVISPINSAAAVCHKLKLNLDTGVNGSHDGVTLLKKKSCFIITDDLRITPFVVDKSSQYLSTLGVECINSLREATIHLDVEECVNLLKWSLSTNNALTNFMNGGSRPYLCSSSIKHTSFGSSAMPKTVKLLVIKSTKKVICAQVDNFFVEMIFSFLTIPLGAVIRLTNDHLSPTGMHNVYNSILSIRDGSYLKSEEVNNMLLDPKLASIYLRVTDLLPIYDITRTRGSFLKDRATFIVLDLQVALSPCQCVSTILNFSIGVPVGDIEVREASIGEREALAILKASLISTSVLTDSLKEFTMEPKAKSST